MISKFSYPDCMKSSGFGNASCVCLVLEVGWSAIVAVHLSALRSESFWTFNQSFVLFTSPVVGLLSLIGVLCGLAGAFTSDRDKTSSLIGVGINGIVLLILSVFAFWI